MGQPPFLLLARQNPENPDRETTTSAKQRHEHIMGKLKDTISTSLSASNPTGSISEDTKSHIEKQLHELFPQFGTPSHPPYALMILTAITKLNEEGGSTEESISGFIEKEYEDLPWGHAAFLSHHLRKLCGTGEIVGKNDGRYVVSVDGCDFGDKEEMGHSMNMRQGAEILHTCHVGDGFQTEMKEEIREDCHLIKQKIEAESQAEGKEKQIELFEQCCQVEKQEVEEESEVSRQDFEATVQQIESTSMELNDGEKYNPQNQQLVVTEDPNPLQILQFEVSDRHTLECGQQTMVMEDQGMLQELQELQEQQIEVMNEKKMEDKISVTISSASQTIGQCLDCYGSPFSLKEPCKELVKKKTESQEPLMENSHSSGSRELPEYDNSGPVMGEEKKDYLKVDQQQLMKSPCTEKASNIEVIEGQKLVQEQEDKLNKEASQQQQLRIELETKLFGFCCYNRDIVSKNFWVSDSALPLAKKEEKKSLKLAQQQTTSALGEKQFIIVCGLQAQKLSQQKIFGHQKALNSHRDNEQQKQSESQAGRSFVRPKLDADTTMSVLLPSDQVRDIEQEHHYQPEGQGQGRPSKPEGNGDHHQSLRIYVRRRRKL